MPLQKDHELLRGIGRKILLQKFHQRNFFRKLCREDSLYQTISGRLLDSMEATGFFYCQKCDSQLELSSSSFKDGSGDTGALIAELRNALGDEVDKYIQPLMGGGHKNAMVAQQQMEKALVHVFELAGDEALGHDFPLCLECVGKIEKEHDQVINDLRGENELLQELEKTFKTPPKFTKPSPPGEEGVLDAKIDEVLNKLEALKSKREGVMKSIALIEAEKRDFDSICEG